MDSRSALLANNNGRRLVPGVLGLTGAAFSGPDNGGNIAITVARTGGSDGIVTVAYATANGTASAPGDYTATSGTLTWNNGESGNKSFNIPVVNDLDLSENLSVTISSPTGGATLGTSSATVTITASL